MDIPVLASLITYKMDVVGAKVVVLILLGLIKLGAGLLPLLLDKFLQKKKVRNFQSYLTYVTVYW